MSDKHTDAQGSTYECGTGDVQRLPDRVVDALIDGAGVSRCAPGQGIYVIDQTAAVEKLVHDTCEELLARLPSPCATEGQAQTSAAVDNWPALLANVDLAGQRARFEAFAWPKRLNFRKHADQQYVEVETSDVWKGWIAHAAQLDDSTAPVAPVDADDAAKATYWFGCLSQCATMLGLDDDEGIPSGVVNAVRKLTSAAPTAQQSLTAGGAVPDERALFEAEIRDIAPVNSGANKRFEDNGEYITVAMELMWKGWQARAAVNAKETAQ